MDDVLSSIYFLNLTFGLVFNLCKSLLSFFYFCFYFQFSRSWVKKDLAVIYVMECGIGILNVDTCHVIS